MPVVNDIVTKLTPLPSVGTIPGNIPSGQCRIYVDASWGSASCTIDTNETTPVDRRYLPSSFVDKATWIAWNLPVGRVVTLTDQYQPLASGKSVGDLQGLGRSVDLVGTGKTETVNLLNCGVNDLLAAWFWREVDLRIGAIEMYSELNFTGLRHTLFLSEWEGNVIHSLAGMWMNDDLTSIKWKTLQDGQTVTFWEHPDGSGTSFNEVKGWGNSKEISDLRDNRFCDVVSAFKWSALFPVKEIIDPVTIQNVPFNALSQPSQHNWANSSPESQTESLSIRLTESETFTVSTTDTFVTGVKVTVTGGSEAKEGPVTVSMSFSVELSYQYSHSVTSTTGATTSIEVSETRGITCAPHGKTIGTLIYRLGKIPPTVYKTTAHRWYTQKITDSHEDQGYYKRDEDITFTAGGGIGSILDATTDFYPYFGTGHDFFDMVPLEGKRIKSSKGEIYLCLDGKARLLTSSAVYQGLFGDDYNGVELLSDTVINAVARGGAITADHALITSNDGQPEIYLLDQNKKRWIQDPTTFNFYGFNWDRVVQKNVNRFVTGLVIKHEE
ncbi:hypothetical protein PV10_07612 [Exophiala mesophila]|uniref:Uncharacterized protein n=1 Tax=Exophiala mesophila TaxID=212818 RepID=A0A0D1ZU10_EXOME|nr:uncharacterized protein PV10_07612 [Exophiala mesophila]KIV90293.1 hypothetical protein PV10_07612 [Exophiala mesophila]